MLEDSDPNKWEMKGQTEVKHRILEKYLDPWLNKISTVSGDIELIDGFAGRGEYNDGSVGSPLIAMDVADKKVRTQASLGQKLTSFRVIAVENDPENYSNLRDCLEEKREEVHDCITAEVHNTKFAQYAEQYIESNQISPNPCFIFIDPFGFSGVPLNSIKNLINLRPAGIELFITFMSGKMAQYLESETHQAAIDEAFGNREWRNRVNTDGTKEERAEELLLYYEERLREEAEISYVWPFQLSEEQKRQTSYHLVHATNHYDGFELMKDIMWAEGAGNSFSYLGPDHYPYEDNQKALSVFDAGNSEEGIWIQELADSLKDEYVGRTIVFDHLLREQYPKTPFITKHFREACKRLDEVGDAKIQNQPNQPGGRNYGLGRGDKIKFLSSQQSMLENFSPE